MTLSNEISKIQTRADLVAFIHKLLLDLRTEPETWENSTLEDYLEAMAAWTEEADGYYANQGLPTPEQPEWRTLAEILIASKYYE